MRSLACPTLEVVWHCYWNILLWLQSSSYNHLAVGHDAEAHFLWDSASTHLALGSAPLLSSAHFSIGAKREAQITCHIGDFWLNCLSPLTAIINSREKKTKQAAGGSQSPSLRDPRNALDSSKMQKTPPDNYPALLPLKRECIFLPRLRESKGTNPGTFI